MTFSEMTYLSLQLGLAQMDGICGLAYSSIAVNGNLPLVQSLKKASVIDKAVVTFNLEHPDKGSEMTIGGEDPDDKDGEFTFHKVTDER